MLRLKSVFIRYMAAFLLINIVSFAILTTAISSIVSSYGKDLKKESLTNAANSAAMFIEQDFARDDGDFEKYLLDRSRDLKLVLELLSVNDDSLLIFIVNGEGQVIHFGGSNYVSISTEAVSDGAGRFFIDESAQAKLKDGVNVYSSDDMNGFFKDIHSYYAIPLYIDGEYTGAIFTASNKTDTDALISAMIKTVLMSVLWILLASLVAVYFISEKLISPIKDMSRAAKSFASGQFDARITVTGQDEISELATAFNNMAASLQNLEDMRRTFLANVSHDLRTPMTTISGFIDGILDGAIPPEQHEHYLAIIASEARRLSRLVYQLLDISRLEAGERKFNMQPYDICEQAREIIISNVQRLEDKRLEVCFECDSENMFVTADKDAIHQILYNICDNAVKVSREGGRYEIRITAREKLIYVSVYNEGTGISRDDLPFIFERFYKSDKSRGVDKTGVGLGLYIARTIIEAHGQKIWAESEQGSWCRFTFTLPAAQENN